MGGNYCNICPWASMKQQRQFCSADELYKQQWAISGHLIWNKLTQLYLFGFFPFVMSLLCNSFFYFTHQQLLRTLYFSKLMRCNQLKYEEIICVWSTHLYHQMKRELSWLLFHLKFLMKLCVPQNYLPVK